MPLDPRTLPVQEQIEFFAAKHIWPMRDQSTPGEGITWRVWFKRRFGRSIDASRADFKGR